MLKKKKKRTTKPGPKPVARRILRKRLVNRLDEMFSLYIRGRDKKRGCPFHATYTQIDCCFHFVHRAKFSSRWDRLNAIGSCHGCNWKYERDANFAISWYITNFGYLTYQAMVARSNIVEPWSLERLQEKRIEIESWLAEPK